MKFQTEAVNPILETLRRAETMGRANSRSRQEISSFLLFYDSINFSQKLAFVNTHVTFKTNSMTRGLIQYLNCSGKLLKYCFCIYILQSEKDNHGKAQATVTDTSGKNPSVTMGSLMGGIARRQPKRSSSTYAIIYGWKTAEANNYSSHCPLAEQLALCSSFWESD